MPPDTTTVGNLSMSWYHAWPFNEPFNLDWNTPPMTWDDFWGIAQEDDPVWSVEASSRAATNTNPYHSVGIVWSMFHIYGPYTKHARHQTEAVTIPTGYGPTGRIRVTGTVSVKVDWGYMVGENRTPTTVPVTVNLDVYDYGEGEPYWQGPPYAALGRTATSVYASCYASNGWNDPVTVPFSFDVPADMLTNIDVVGGFQWGVKIYDPEGVLSNLSGEGRGIVTAGANSAAATASVNGGSLQYAVSYAQGGGTSYFCIPPVDYQPGADQPSSGYICHDVTHAGGTDFTTLHNFAQLSLEVYVNGIRQFDFTSVGSARTFTLPEAIAADDFLRVCYNALPNLYGAPS